MKRSIKWMSICVIWAALAIPTAWATEVTVFCDNSYPPYSFEEGGKAAGIYADIFTKAFSRMKGYEVTIRPVPWKRGLNLMEEGKGFALYPPYHRPEERPYMDYPVPVLAEGYAMFTTEKSAVKPDSQWPEAYAGLKIGINAGYSIPQMDKAKGLGIQFEEAASSRANLLKLASGRIDGYINDKNACLWELKRLKQAGEYNESKHEKIIFTGDISQENGYLGVTNKNQDQYPYKTDFVSQFTEIIKEMKQNGEIQSILDAYIK